MNKSLAVVMAHPDDVEIHIGGTLCLLRRKGYRLHFINVCNGDCGSHTEDRASIARIRRREAEEAARMLEASYDCLGVGDLRVVFDVETKNLIVDALRKHQADVVITHARQDYMADHEITAELTREACFAAPAPNWETPKTGRKDVLKGIPELYHADPTSQEDSRGQIVRAQMVVNISSVMQQKRTLLACHVSQRAWLAQHHGEDNYLKSMEDWARARGRQVGFEFGEGLTQHLGHPFPKHSTLKHDLADLIRI
jgi:LmbE family N-acetylglucosaminyl deacetylase